MHGIRCGSKIRNMLIPSYFSINDYVFISSSTDRALLKARSWVDKTDTLNALQITLAKSVCQMHKKTIKFDIFRKAIIARYLQSHTGWVMLQILEVHFLQRTSYGPVNQ